MTCFVLAILTLTALPTDFAEVPSDLVPFCRDIVQRRAAEGLNRVVHDEQSPKYGTVYGGQPEDANIAWLAAAAWRYDWSRFHHDEALQDEAFFLLDNLARIRADGRWDDGGLNAYFGLQSFGWAVYEWLDNGCVDEPRAQVWRAAVKAAADDAMAAEHYNLYAGDYANPEFYYLAGLAAAWKVTGDERYRTEAALALHRYDDSIYDGGGVSYFRHNPPEHGYQQMVSKGVVLYYLLTGDDYAKQWLDKLKGYFPLVQTRSGLVTDNEVPHLKHGIYAPVNPAVPMALACLTGDGRNRTVADTACRLRADNVRETMPSYLEKNPNWYNYHHTTYAAMALRVLDQYPLPDPAPLEPREILVDAGFRGVRSHWDDFTAAVGTRRTADTVAGAYLADEAEPMWPLGAAVDGVRFEILEGERGPDANAGDRARASKRVIEWDPTLDHVTRPEFKAVSVLSRLCSPYWGDFPWQPGERWRLDEFAGWTTLQHWAVWRDHLVGLGALRCQVAGGNPDTDDQARVLYQLTPVGRPDDRGAPRGDSWTVAYGGLALTMVKLGDQGGFEFDVETDRPAPQAAWAPQVVRQAPWAVGDYLELATDIAPASSDGVVFFQALNECGAALCVEPSRTSAWLWIANLTRHFRQQFVTLPAGCRATVYKRDIELPPPPAEICVVSLQAGESGVVRLESDTVIQPEAVLAGIQAGWGRGERRPERP